MRRPLLALLLGSALVALSTPGAKAQALLVTNRGSGSLALLDEAALTVRKVIAVGERAWGVAVAPDGKAACVSYAAGLAILNLDTGAVEQRMALGGQGMGVAMSRNGALCYVAVNRSDGDRLVAVERSGGRVRGQVPIGERAFGIYLSPDGRTLYVPEHDAFALSVIDAASLAKRRTIPLKPLGEGAFDKPHYLAISPDGATLYLPFQGRALVAVDTATFSVTSHPQAINAHQHGIAISPDGSRLYLANNVFGGTGSLSEIDVKTFRELRRIPLGKDHEQVALAADGRRVYLTGGFALGGHDELTVVDLATAAITRVGTGGKRPFAILRVP
ncbi:MAG: PD40 domain-containing protein [Candidatus Rokubacteria bacterium]|nr:PD40 domain-containing protein [Candidatus Rokubacteria bacterium]